jgi:hypothetical protein
MTMSKRIIGAAALVALTAAFAVPNVATAHSNSRAGTRTFQQTYPIASRLCASVAAGTERKRLQPVATQILADCTELEKGFAAAETAVLATRATIAAQIAADHAAIHAACPAPLVGKPACENVRHSNKVAIKALVLQRLAAVHAFYKTLETNRRTFWHAIHLLRPAAHIHADTKIKVHDT